MSDVSTITKKGQVTIPVSIRREWGLFPEQRVVFIKRRDSKVEIRPATDFFSLRGSIRTRSRYSDKKANRVLRQYFSKDYGQKA